MEPVAVDAPIATATGAFFTRRQLAVVVAWPPPEDPAPAAADAWGDAAAAARGASAMGGALLAQKLCPRLAASAAFVTASAVPYGLGRRSAAVGDVDERGDAAFSHVGTVDDALLVLEAWNARPTLSLRVAAGDAAVVLDLARFVFPVGYVQSPGWKSNIRPDFNVRVIEGFGPDSSAVLRELAEINRFVHKSAESTSI